MEKIKESLLKLFSIYVYVVIANKSGRVKECKVYFNYSKAREKHNTLMDLYGYNNMCFLSRKIM